MKRIFAIILALALTAAMLPIAFADELPLEVTLDAQAGTLEQVKEIAVNITNPNEAAASGSVTITGPDGWTVSSDAASFSVDSEESTSVKFSATPGEKVAFNLYYFNVTVTSASGEVLFKDALPLPFLAVVKVADEFDMHGSNGNISSWADAYPVFINVPSNASDISGWRNATASAVCYMKWDDNNFYFIINNYDDTYVAEASGSGIWSYDSVQISIDCLNNKSNEGYDDGCYEYGMAYAFGLVEVYTWHAPEVNLGNQRDPSLGKVVRDDTLNLTRYMMKLDADNIAPLQLKEGYKFGMNLVVNDVDIITRNGYETSGGTVYGKNPSLYDEYTLVDVQSAGAASNAATVDIEMDWENSFVEYDKMFPPIATPEPTAAPTPRPRPDDESMFIDMDDHWAKANVEEMASGGIINGYEDKTFRPENNITRAEFTALITRIGLDLVDYEGGLSDISADDWFAANVQTGVTLGIIPAEMIADGAFYPEKQITREEMCCMIVNMFALKTGSAFEDGDSVFTDEGDFASWTIASVNAAAKAGIVTGYPDGDFRPTANATRAEAATMVKRLLDKF